MKQTIDKDGPFVVLTDDPDFLSQCMKQGVPAVGCLLPEGKMPKGLPSGCTVLDMEGEEAKAFLLDNPLFVERVMCRAGKQPFRPVRTKRLRIGELGKGDGEMLFSLLPQCRELGMMEQCTDSSDCEAWIAAYQTHMYELWDLGLWGIFLDERLIGLAGLEPGRFEDALELGYFVDKAYRRRGYALEACSGILAYTKEELGEPTVVCRIYEKNLPSQELAGRLKEFYPRLRIELS